MGDEGGERRLGRGGATAVEEDVEGEGREKSRSLARFFFFSIGDAKSGSSEEMLIAGKLFLRFDVLFFPFGFFFWFSPIGRSRREIGVGEEDRRGLFVHPLSSSSLLLLLSSLSSSSSSRSC